MVCDSSVVHMAVATEKYKNLLYPIHMAKLHANTTALEKKLTYASGPYKFSKPLRKKKSESFFPNQNDQLCHLHKFCQFYNPIFYCGYISLFKFKMASVFV